MRAADHPIRSPFVTAMLARSSAVIPARHLGATSESAAWGCL